MWHAMLVNSVADIGGNIDSDLDSTVGGGLFLRLFPKTGSN